MLDENFYSQVINDDNNRSDVWKRIEYWDEFERIIILCVRVK